MLANFSVIEIVWTLIALVGVYFAALNAWEALNDLRALGGLRNGRYRIAFGNVRREALRISVFVTYVVIGILAGQNPPPVIPSSPFLGIILIGTSVTLVINSILDRRDRMYLLATPLRSPSVPETQNQYEDRLMGDQRRKLPSIKDLLRKKK